jgi:glycosyltransferase involved in cell wall biosynthesis
VKPVLFVTGRVAADRHGALRELHRRVGIELALFGGPHAHGAPDAGPPPGVPHRHVSQAGVGRLVAARGHRAVIVGTGGRIALPAAWAAARVRGVPFVFWAALWRTPLTPAHVAAHPLLLDIYRRADAVVTYGEHVSGYVAARGARRIQIAPQSVDNDFWSAGGPAAARAPGPLRALFVGRPAPAKGLPVLLEAWAGAGLAATGATLDVVGCDAAEVGPPPAGVTLAGRRTAGELRNFYGRSDVLVVPSIPTRAFLEPWGLVVNEAMNQASAIISTTAVGAAAGGLVRDRRNGLVVGPGDAGALAGALRTLAGDLDLCLRLGRAGARDVRAFTHDAWAAGFAAALAGVQRLPDPLVA